jgi:hypothetical protein
LWESTRLLSAQPQGNLGLVNKAPTQNNQEQWRVDDGFSNSSLNFITLIKLPLRTTRNSGELMMASAIVA